MRFMSDVVKGLQVFSVTGVNTVSFAIAATDAARKGLLGFSVERFDPEENQRSFMRGYKVFRSLIPDPDETTNVSTFVHPIQSFVWDDFTAKADRRYVYSFLPFRGTAKQPKRDAPIDIEVHTEPLFAPKEVHDVFFNRGVASSQVYAKRFHNQHPDLQPTPEKRQEAWEWLTRDLQGAIIKFIDDAKQGDELLCCFYEFRYRPVADALMRAIGRGADVKLIVDAKVNEFTDNKGNFHPSFPREDNLELLADVKFPMDRVVLRTQRDSYIQHNKFMVLVRNGKPSAVWTGSTNISVGGIYGQTNVGHWVRDAATASAFVGYWKVLSTDPGKNGTTAAARKANEQFRKDVEALAKQPKDRAEVAKGVTPVFSPRLKLDMLKLYASLVDSAAELSCITLAFGINKEFKSVLADNSPAASPLVMMMLEKADLPPKKPKPGAKPPKNPPAPWVAINSTHNVYKAWGSFLRDAVHQFVRETDTRVMRDDKGNAINSHVVYVHSKFLLQDPLGKDPLVVTGSANFSDPSTTANDENMLLIRGDYRAADIYFTEFNRIFAHYYYRAVQDARRAQHDDPDANVFLAEKPEDWLGKYKPGTFRTKKVDAYRKMHVPA